MKFKVKKKSLAKVMCFVALSVLMSLGVATKAMAVAVTGVFGSVQTLGNAATAEFSTNLAIAFQDANVSVSVGAITVTENGTLGLEQGADTGAASTAIASIAVATGKTLTIINALNVDGAAIGDGAVALTITAATTGLGTLVIKGSDGLATGDSANIAGTGAISIANFTVRSGNGITGSVGSTMEIVDLGTASLGISSTNYTAKAGDGATGAANRGGILTITQTTADVSSANYVISGGDGATPSGATSGGAGGSVVQVAHLGDITGTNFTVTGGAGAIGGAAGTGGAGGAVAIASIAGAVTATNVNVTGGAGAAGMASDVTGIGGVGGAITDADFDGTVNSIVIIKTGDGGDGGVGAGAVGGAGGDGGAVAGTVFTAAATGNVTVQGGKGGDGGVTTNFVGGAGGAGGANTGTIVATIAGDLSIIGGNGGAASAASTTATAIGAAGGAGGAATFAEVETRLTGNLVITGGTGSSGSAAQSGGIGAVGGDGGAATMTKLDDIDGVAAATGVNITVTGGNAGNGGANTAGADGGAAGAGGLAVITASAGAGDLETLALVGGNGGNGGVGHTGNAGIAGGLAGTSIATFDTATTFESRNINVTGGNAGNGGASGTSQAGGAGTVGGLATLTMNNAAVTGQATGTSTIKLTGGNGGNGGNAGSGVAGVAGVAGGAALLDFGGAASTANIILNAGTAGTKGTDNGARVGGAKGAGGEATIAFTAVHSLTGNITAASDNEGVITTATGATTIVGSIGSNSKAVKQINLGHGMLISGDLYAKDITSSAATGDLTFTSTTLQTVSAAIDSTGSDADVILEANAIVTFKGALGKDSGGSAAIINALTLGATSTSVYESTVNATTATLADNANITVNGLFHTTGAITAANNTTTVITVGSGFTYGSGTTTASSDVITAAGGWVDSTRVANTITLNMPSDFQTGHLVVIQAGGANVTAAELAAFKVTDTALVDYTVVDGAAATYTGTATTQDVVVTATKKSSATIASALGITKAAGAAFSSASTAMVGNKALRDALSTALATGGATAAKVAEQVQGSPDGLGAISGAATASTGAAAISVGSSRMAALRSGTAYASLQGTGFNAGSGQSNDAYASTFGTGFSAGSGITTNSMWMKPFASFGDQQRRKGVDGYEADTYGLAIGGDRKINENSIAGLSVSYAQTDVDGKGAGKSHSDIASYQVTAYGDYTRDDWYVEGLVGYAYNDLKTTRTISVSDAKAKGDTDSGQYMASLNAGMPMKIDGDSGAYFTPTIGVNITHVDNKEYTETGAGVLNLKINPEDITLAKASLGGRLHTSLDSTDGIFVPELRVKLLYDMAGDDGSSTNTFTGGGAAFQVDGLDVVEFSSSVGLGLAFSPNDKDMEGMSFSVNFDAEMKEDFIGQSGNFSFRYAF